MEKQFSLSGYQITTDLQFQNNKYGVTPELEKLFQSLYNQAQNKINKKIIDKLTQLITQYPTVPIIKNYLSVAYGIRGNYEKAAEVNQWILAEHPDYLFAIINQANIFIEEKEYSKVPEIMGPQIELKAFYPDRDLFHLAEVTGFYRLAIRYYAAIGNMELAESRFQTLKEIAPYHADTKHAESYLLDLILEKPSARFENENKERISPISTKLIPNSQKTIAPKFNHPEIKNLYRFGLTIPHEKLNEIIALPHDSLVEDLEKMLVDAVERHAYFCDIDWQEETHNYVLHALILLKEINAVESLPQILEFLKYDDKFTELWLGDHVTTSLWQCIYSLGFNNTTLLKEFLLLPGIDTYCKTAVSEALCQMIIHHPEKRNEVLAIYTEVFTVFSEANVEDNLIDPDFLGLTISDVLHCNLPELLPLIKVLFSKRYVTTSINGYYSEIKKEFGSSSPQDHKYELHNIFEIYEDVLQTWASYREEEDEPFCYDTPEQAVSTKIGRNEPCPCGSGKKHKKCCL